MPHAEYSTRLPDRIFNLHTVLLTHSQRFLAQDPPEPQTGAPLNDLPMHLILNCHDHGIDA